MAKDPKKTDVDDELEKLKSDPRAGTMKNFIRETIHEWFEEEQEKRKKDNEEKPFFDVLFGR